MNAWKAMDQYSEGSILKAAELILECENFMAVNNISPVKMIELLQKQMEKGKK